MVALLDILHLVEQVGRNEYRVGAAVRDDEGLGRTEDYGVDAVSTNLELSQGHRRATGTHDHAMHRNRLGAERSGSDASRAVDAKQTAKTQLVGDDQHRGIDLTPAPGSGGHDNR